MDIPQHREQVSYGRVLMLFRSIVKLDHDETKEVELAYIEEYWQYKRNNRYSMVGSGNVQLYAPKVYHVIPIERILCKADILPDLVTTTIPEDALPASAAARARDYPHAKPGSELYIYNNWSMQWGLHPGNPPKEAPMSYVRTHVIHVFIIGIQTLVKHDQPI